MNDIRPHELREMLEREVRDAFAEAFAQGLVFDATFVAASVLARHQHRADVCGRIAVLWTHLEHYAAQLALLGRVD